MSVDEYEQRTRQRFSEAVEAFDETFYARDPQDVIRPLSDALIAFLSVIEREPLITAETVICSDCGKDATPACERDGHGLDTLGDLIEWNTNGDPSVRELEESRERERWLRTELEFYAEETNWLEERKSAGLWPSKADIDRGKRARAALVGQEQDQ
jgi:hypothetical protein